MLKIMHVPHQTMMNFGVYTKGICKNAHPFYSGNRIGYPPKMCSRGAFGAAEMVLSEVQKVRSSGFFMPKVRAHVQGQVEVQNHWLAKSAAL